MAPRHQFSAVSALSQVLPEPLQRAQAAVALPEVVAAMQMLAKHGLGICMPHAHSAERDFDVLPVGMVQVERNQIVTFETADTAQAMTRIPVAWRYEEANGVARVTECGCCHFDPVTQSHNRP